jgi:L-xylulokinase
MEPAQIAGHVTDAAAKVTGLAVGTPVIAGFFDVVASAMGSGAVRPGEASIVVGSWSINQVFSTSPVIDARVFMVSAFAPARFVNMENSATSAANLEWYVRTLVERGAHTGNSFNWVNDAVGRTKPSADDPLFHPFLYGARMGAHQRGGFYGLAGWHDEGHLLRALFEGVMFEHRRHIEVLASAGVTFEKAALSGGGTRSPHWPQMFADGLGVPVTIAECDETGALGAAMGAAIAVGLYPNYETAVSGMTRTKSTFVPDSALRLHYDRRYAVWTRLTAAMDPFWLELRGD